MITLCHQNSACECQLKHNALTFDDLIRKYVYDFIHHCNDSTNCFFDTLMHSNVFIILSTFCVTCVNIVPYSKTINGPLFFVN